MTEVVASIEAYLAGKDLDKVIKSLVTELLQAKPELVSPFLLQLLLHKNTGASTAEVSVSEKEAEVEAEGCVVGIAHKDAADQEYINSQRLADTFKSLTDLLLKEKPGDMLSCLNIAVADMLYSSRG